MSKTTLLSQADLEAERISAISGLRARLATLGPMDWIVILLFIVGIVIDVYTTTLRHP